MAWCCFSVLSPEKLLTCAFVVLLLDCLLGARLYQMTGATDVCALMMSRAVFLPLICFLSLRFWKSTSSSAREMNEMRVPMMTADAEARVHETERWAAVTEEHARVQKIRNEAAKKINVALAVAFALVTVGSFYTGIKTVTGPKSSAVIFIAQILIMNLEFFLLKDGVQGLTLDMGISIPEHHCHPLHVTLNVYCHSCDVCGESIESHCYRCRTCDFDMCTRLSLEFWPTLITALLCLLFSRVSLLATPNIQGQIFDTLIPGQESYERFKHLIVIYLIANVVQGALGAVKGLSLDLVGRKLANVVRNRLFQSIVRQDIAYFDSTHTGNLTSRLNNDASAMVQPMRTILNDLIGNAIMLVGGTTMCFYTNWRLAVLAATSLCPITYTLRLYARWSRRVFYSIWQAYGEANTVCNEALGNMRTVRAFGAEGVEIGSYLDLGTTVLILWYGGLSVFHHGDEQLYWNLMNQAFTGLSDVFNELIRASSAAERVFQVMDLQPDINPTEGLQISRDELQGSIELRDVSFFYSSRPDTCVLNRVSLTFPRGTVTALVGKSGGGKSTLMHLLMRFYDPTSGCIQLDGRDIRELFATSILKNLTYGCVREGGRAPSREEIVEATTLANAHEFIMELEEGYETRVGEKGCRLSGGQKQRIAIARCFLRQPKLLFLDEATSALDSENEASVQSAVDRLIAQCGSTVVLIAHRLSTVVNADNIAVVSKGAVVEQGRHAGLMEKGGVYAQLVSRQAMHDANKIAGLDEREGEEEEGGRWGERERRGPRRP